MKLKLVGFFNRCSKTIIVSPETDAGPVSLRQLSLKFLSKEELVGFSFQRVFLAPFEVIMRSNSSLEVSQSSLEVKNHLIQGIY